MFEIHATQQCRTCSEVKPLEDFDVRADTGKRKTQCRACRRAYQNARNARLHPTEPKPQRVVGTREHLRCTRCGELKPAVAFPPRRRGEDPLQSWCRDCFAAVNAARYAAKHETERARLRRNVDATRRANQSAVLTYLAEHPCVDCGERDAVVLEFDHLTGKRADVSKMINSGATWRLISTEIAKCVVRCANCHRIRTGQRTGVDQLVLQFELVGLMTESGGSTPTIDATIARTCRACGLDKPLTEFAFRSLEDGTHVRICRICQSEYHRGWYQRSRVVHLERARRRRVAKKVTREGVRHLMWQHLLQHPCVDCGATDVRILDFDHLRDKKAEVGALVRSGASWGRVANEIAKCEVRCANCHRRKTSRNAGGYRTLAEAVG